MGLKTSCDGCGSTVLGITNSLKIVNGRYLCPACASNPQGVGQFYCSACNMYFPHKGKKGNGWVELILYLFYIVPGVIYSIWRRSGGGVCPKCKSASLISAAAGTHIKCPDCRELVLKEARKCKHCGCTLVPQ
jgi:hypothetical protein